MRRAAAALGLAWAVLGCGRPPAPGPPEANDLVALLDLATVRRETRLIDLGAPGGRALLEDGWSWDEPDGGGFVWGVGRRSQVRFFLVTTRDLPLTLRGGAPASPDGEPQQVTVTVNSARLEMLELLPEIGEHRLTVPAASLVPGWNRLELGYRHWRPGPVIRRLAARWDSIRFGEAEPGGAAFLADGHEGTLLLPYGVQLEYYLRLPEAATLEIDELGAGADPGAFLELFLEPEGAAADEVTKLLPGRDLRLELGNRAPGVARLALRAIGAGPEGGLTLRRPRVEPPVVDAGWQGEVRPNVIIYLIDALRADRVGAYGHAGRLTPHIDELASDALRFDAVAQSSWTKPAIASLFTGRLPPSHGVLLRADALPSRVTTLAELLLAAGYRTAAFSTNPFVSRSFGLDQGFLDFDYLDAGRAGTHHALSDDVNERVFAWLDREIERPFLLYLHTMDPHAPYARAGADGAPGDGEDPPPRGARSSPGAPACREERPLPEPERRRLIHGYEREIAANDRSFGRLVAELRARGLYERSVIILLSDHGEAFWEHRGWRHRNSLYAEVTDVPLLIKPPRGADRAAAPGLAQQVDVLPTILDLLRLPVPAAVQGRSLVATGDGRRRSAAFSFLECEAGKRIAAVLAGPWKLIRTADAEGAVRSVELYHRRRDPAEQTDVAGARPEIVERLLALLEAREADSALESAPVEIGDELTETLRGLGYLD